MSKAKYLPDLDSNGKGVGKTPCFPVEEGMGKPWVSQDSKSKSGKMEQSAIPEFGIKRENEERRDGGCGVIFDPETGLFAVGRKASTGLLILFSGGVDAHEDMQEGILREVREESGLHDFKHVEKIGEALAHYHNSSKNVSRVAHARCFLAILNSKVLVPTKLEAHEDFSLELATADDLLTHWRERNTNEDYSHWIYFLENAQKRLNELGYFA